MKRTLAIAVALLAVAPAGSALGASASFNDVEAQLMCDTCNVALPIAESTRADQERRQIRRLIAQGKTRQQILDIFAAEYGPNVLAKPTGGGSAVAAWAVPAVIIAVAIVSVALLLPRWRRRRRDDGDDGPSGGPPLSPDDAERLERDLALYDL
ncbi:MAG: cytochrome c-type biosis protein CcmH [Solirubrobacteraceae bacterium]|nr:cytochrome c-type biosis protein CcmH [Solirubrobacteraceae bacterium]